MEAAGAEERGQRRAAMFWSQMCCGEAHEAEHQADRHHELHDERLTFEAAHDQAVEADAEERRGDEHDED